MNSTAGAPFHPPRLHAPGGARARFALGIAVSLAVHLLLATAWRAHLPTERDKVAARAPRALAVWIRPPPPAAAEQSPAPAATPVPATPRAQRPRRVIAVPRRERDPDRHVVQQADDPAPQADSDTTTPRFDREAALRTARQIASEPDPSGAPRPPLQAETRLGRAISAAKRRDCKDGLPGGLLGPVIILFDKKDSGCKW